MKLIANKKNLETHAQALLGAEYSDERKAELIKEALTGFERVTGHISHSRAAHLERLDKILGNYGVDGILLDEAGEDVSGTCHPSRVAHDIQYSNSGDSYTITLLYHNGKLCIGDWGSILETAV